MKKNVFVLALMCCLTLMAQAQVAKYCMTYSDYVAGNWKSVDDLTKGQTKQVCQMKNFNNCYSFKTGVKDADKMLKRDAFAVMYGGHLYVNCRNLRNDGVQLDVTGYTQAVRYGKDKVCVMAYKTHDASLLLGFGLSMAGCFVGNTAVSLGLEAAGTACWIGNEFLSRTVCYLVDSDANEKGKMEVTRVNDKFMENLLNKDASLFEKYMAISNKRSRQSSANVLPILMEKGLVASSAIN